MKKFTPLDRLPQVAMTATKNYLRYFAEQVKAKGCTVCEPGVLCKHLAMLSEVADSIIALDDHMKGGGELPTGWSFFSQNGRDGK